MVLVPYVSYQRMLETTGNSKTVGDIHVNSRSTQMTKLADEINMSPPPLRKKMKPKIVGSDDIVITPPPLGKRNIPPEDVPRCHLGRSGTGYHFENDNRDIILFFCIFFTTNKHIKL